MRSKSSIVPNIGLIALQKRIYPRLCRPLSSCSCPVLPWLVVLPTYSQRCHSQSPPWARQRWGWSTRHPRQGLGNIPRTKWVLGEPHVISFLNWVHFKRISFFLCPDQTCQISISITIRVFKGQGVHLGVRGKSVGVPKDQMAKCKLWIINDKSPIAYHK